MPSLTPDQANAILRDAFAPWVLDLDLVVEAVGEGSARLRMRRQERVARIGGTVSGQALTALGDTAMVIALAASFGGFRPVATVTLTTTFLRAVRAADVLAEARVLRLARSLAFAEVAMRADGSEEVVATVSGTFALPPPPAAG